jgi:hypothetical protein
MRPVCQVIQCHQFSLPPRECDAYEALARTAAVPEAPGVTTVAQVLPFIDLMDLCQPAEGS